MMFHKLFICFVSTIIIVSGKSETKCYGSGTATDLTIIWNSTNGEYTLTPAKAGETLTPPDCANEPSVSWNFDSKKFYHFLMVDPDAPTPQNATHADILHCMIINIQKQNDIDAG
eukprot:222333_1